MMSIRQFVSIAITGLLGLTPAVVSASPPTLSDLVVEPTILTLGSGSPTISFSVTATDPDGDLNPEKTKVTVKFEDKSKEKATLLDQGGGRFMGQIEIDTATAQTLTVNVKAKDLAKEKAEKLTTTIVITDAAITPTAITTEQTEWEGDSGEIIVLQTRVIGQQAPEVGVPNWPVTFSVDAGDGTILPPGEAASIREDPDTNGRPVPTQVVTEIALQSVAVLTDAEGFASIEFEIGDASLSSIQAAADGVPTTVRFSIQSFGIPTGIAIDPDGVLFVLDGALRTIVRIDPDTRQGTVASGCPNLRCETQVGTGPQLSLPMAMAIDNNGALIVADRRLSAVLLVETGTGNRTVISGCVNSNCTQLVGTGPAIDFVTGVEIAMPADETIVVTDFQRVIRIDPQTGDRTVVTGCLDDTCAEPVGNGPVFVNPQAIAAEPDGSLIVIYNRPSTQAVVRVHPLTGDRTVISGCVDDRCIDRIGDGARFAGRRAMAVAPDGALAVTDTRRRGVLRIDPESGDRTLITGCLDGACAEQAGIGQALGFPTAVTFRPNGAMIVVDQSRGDIIVVNPETGDRNAFFGLRHRGPPFSLPNAIAMLDAQTFVVSDADFGALLEVDARTGDRVKISGCLDFRCTEQIGGGPPLSAPIAISANSDQGLFVVDESLDAVLRVDSQTGDRSIVSGCRDSECSTQVGEGPQMRLPSAVATAADGTLVVATQGLRAVVQIDRQTGDRTVISGCRDEGCSQPVGVGPLPEALTDMAFGRGKPLFILDREREALLQVDLQTGDRTVVSNVDNAHAVTVAPDGTPVVAQTRSLIRVDPETGRQTTISNRQIGRGLPFLSLTDIVTRPDGTFFITDRLLRAVLGLDPETGRRRVLSR